MEGGDGSLRPGAQRATVAPGDRRSGEHGPDRGGTGIIQKARTRRLVSLPLTIDIYANGYRYSYYHHLGDRQARGADRPDPRMALQPPREWEIALSDHP